MTTERVQVIRGRGSRIGWQKSRSSGPPEGLARDLLRERCRRGLSQSTAAAEIPVDRVTWARWELGEEPKLPVYGPVLRLWLAGRWPVEGRE